ncbi:MAG: PASTA domain-containing protein [Bacteroidia bacterium]|nr:PASTA domain-containing protein [Bacteroidia bacterium]
MLRYFISREFLLTLIGLGLLGVLLYLAVFFWIMPVYTRHGSGVLVPDVSEKPYKEAVAILKKSKLRPTADPDSVFMENLPPGVIIKQYPAPYSRVKPNRTISLTINKFQPPMVAMPEVVDQTLYQAKVRLENWGLSIGKVMRKPDFAENAVLEAKYKGGDITPGTKIPRGSKIDVIVGSGLVSGKVTLPDLTGYTYEDAIAILTELNLGLGSVVYEENAPAEQIGKIYDQRPRYIQGDSVNMGSSIDLYIYGSEPTSNEGIVVEGELPESKNDDDE